MSDGLYGIDEFETLVRADSVLEGAFECLRRIWGPADALDPENLTDAEYKTLLLEQHLASQDPKLYAGLKERMGDHPITELDHGCGVVMDALSLREGFQLARDVPEEHGWEVDLDWAPIERLPSETQFVCREWFDAQSPSAVSRDDYRYVGDMDVPQLPGTDPEYVWTRHPDRRLEDAKKGNYSMEDVEDIYEDTKELLAGIVRESVHDEFLVTSDHGYVHYGGGNPYALTEDQEEALSSKFSGRWREVEEGHVLQTLFDAGIIDRVGGYFVVRGHYESTKRGPSKRIMHGGMSSPECMTPVLRIST